MTQPPDNLKTTIAEWRSINEGGSAPCTQCTALAAEVARLLDIVQRGPATAYLEAAQRCADDRLTYLKHAERAATARAELAENALVRIISILGGPRECSAGTMAEEAIQLVEAVTCEARHGTH